MKQPEIGDYLLWRGEPAEIIGTADSKVVIIRLLKNPRCPHCKGELEEKHLYVVASSPMFKDGAKPMPTI
jgi:hypothetical protein